MVKEDLTVIKTDAQSEVFDKTHKAKVAFKETKKECL